ncbi:Insulin-induced 1 protein, partial [Dissostichus eleginoides]
GGWRNQKKSLLENVIVSGGADDTLLTAHGGLNAYPLHGPHHLHFVSRTGLIFSTWNVNSPTSTKLTFPQWLL